MNMYAKLGLLALLSANALFGMEKPSEDKPRVYNTPSLRFLVGEYLSQRNISIDEANISNDLKEYVQFIKKFHEDEKKSTESFTQHLKKMEQEFDLNFPLQACARITLESNRQTTVQMMLLKACQTGILDETLLNDLYALNNQLKLEETGFFGFPFIQDAVCNGHLRVVELLLKYGANIHNRANIFGVTPLIALFQHSKMPFLAKRAMFQLLLQKGANINDVTNEGNTALQSAVMSQNMEDVDLLLEHKPDINYQDENKKESINALACAIMINNKKNALVLMEKLLKEGADPEKEYQNLSPICLCVSIRFKEGVRLLKQYKAQIDGKPGSINALHWAISDKPLISFIQFLFEEGADPNLRCLGVLPLSLALENTNFDIAECLLDASATIPTNQNDMILGLKKLIDARNTKLLKRLLDMGAHEFLEDEAFARALLHDANREMRNFIEEYEVPCIENDLEELASEAIQNMKISYHKGI